MPYHIKTSFYLRNGGKKTLERSQSPSPMLHSAAVMNRRHFLALPAFALPALAQHHDTPAMPPAADVLHDLTAGNARFAAGHAKRPHGNMLRVHQVASAQAPRAV